MTTIGLRSSIFSAPREMPKISPLAGVVAGLVAFLFIPESVQDSQLYSVANALIAIGATSLGFMVTALSIFAALINRDLFQKLIATGYFRELTLEMFMTAAAFLAITIIALASLFLSGAPLHHTIAVSIGVFTLAIFLLCSAGYKFYVVLGNVK